MSSSATSRQARAGDQLSIGEVLAELQPDFPDVSHSKLRFLEDRGLVTPERTQAGYRKFTRQDVDRLRAVLTLQRDRYMPLKKIGEYFDALDRGLQPPELPGGAPRAPRAVPGPQDPDAGRLHPARRLRLRRDELLAACGLTEVLLAALEQFGLLQADTAGYFGADDLEVARVAGELAGYGIEARHLRAFRTAADREVALVDAVTTPVRRGRAAGSGARADEQAREIAALCLRLHTALVRAGLDEATARG